MGHYCLDANVLVTSWGVTYPPRIFNTFWERLVEYRDEIIFIEPIYNEIDPISPTDKKLDPAERRKKYPLRMWLQDNGFNSTPINGEVNSLSLQLEAKYEIGTDTKGANQNDITLIAYAIKEGKKVITLESSQFQRPGKKSNYKIPLICNDEGVECLNFVAMLDQIGLRVQA